MNGWTLLSLNDCYRCGSKIVKAANNLIRHNKDRIPKDMVSATGTTGEVTVTCHDTAAEEAAGIAKQLKDLTASGETPWHECAVLLRTNKLAGEYREVLKVSGIPVRERRQQDNPPDWAAARAFIALLTNPESERLASKFIALRVNGTLAESMQRQATADFTTINEKFLHIRHMQLADVTTAMVAATLSRESIGRVRQMIDLLQPAATVLELQGALLEAEAEALELTPGVTVSTAHSSKGQEYQCVFICACEEKIWPGARADQNIEEEKRLFYVAITRAKRLVSISYAKRRNREWSGSQIMEPSRFIQECLS